MTKEEAIERLNRCREILEITSHMDNQSRKAFDIAFQALEQEPCEDCISRQAVLEAMGEQPLNWMDSSKEIAEEMMWEDHVKALKELPSVTPQPKTGHWIYTGDCITDGMLKCSECGFEHDVSESFSYCPNCGRRMQEVEE